MPFAQRREAYARRHHVRHELRVRLRLPARQHGRLARGRRPARPLVRDRRRGRLDPDRRGAHAADHLRRAGDRREGLLRLRARREDDRRGSRPQEVQKGFEPDADYVFDEKFKTVSPLPSAIEKIERALKIENLYDPRNVQLVNHLNQALKAQSLYQRDVDYVVQDGEVKIVDEFTGRIMEGRRWSEGLHQAVEAKEGVRIQEENVTLATITLQNYFRLYEKLAGMTGTAKTEEKEFVEIYDLHVVEIPTNVAGRARRTTTTTSSRRRKRSSTRCSTTSSSATRRASRCSSARSRSRRRSTSRSCSTGSGIPHNVLNAKQHEREAEIIIGRRASSARSRSRRTWPAAASTSSSAKACASSAASTCSAPSATRRGASTTSSAAAPAARATPASRASTSRARTTSCACSRATGSRTS